MGLFGGHDARVDAAAQQTGDGCALVGQLHVTITVESVVVWPADPPAAANRGAISATCTVTVGVRPGVAETDRLS
jgi:hypothetical protein